MSTAPTLCPACLALNRVATTNGPTCPHHPISWWPTNWDAMTTEQRVAWIEANQPKD